jgi:hypothetical protein
VPGIVDEAAWPDQVRPDDVGLEVVERCGAAFTEAEQGEMGSAEEVEQAFRRAGERVAAGGVWAPARPASRSRATWPDVTLRCASSIECRSFLWPAATASRASTTIPRS